MNLGSKILAAATLAAVPGFAGLAAAAPLGTTPAPMVQNVDWRGGHWHGEYFPDPRGFEGPGLAFGAGPYAYSAGPYAYSYGYDYDPGYSTYAYGPGYDYGYSYSSPDSDYGYAGPTVGIGPGRGDIAYCQQRFRSYDPSSGTYLGYDGIRHSCP